MRIIFVALLVGCGAKTVATEAVYEIPVDHIGVTPTFDTVGDIIEARAQFQGPTPNRTNVQCTVYHDQQGGTSRFPDLLDGVPADVTEELPTGAPASRWYCEFLSLEPGIVRFEVISGGRGITDAS